MRQLPTPAGNGTTLVDLSELANGVYLLRVSAPDQALQTLRFAKY
ncbi:T9SS type A sorting domain-containing protein [Hymenobacter sp. BRD67]|nr:T9SS type A sorting domain-containing protein [Hymenobacter sp. BRD67]QKG51693.1 T9SS type A sorting domain-containing protein [Hymenobacter sp. BRD67]